MTRTRYRQILSSRESSSERARLYRLGDHLRKRLAQRLETPRQDSPCPMDSHTERINRLLVLWLDLQHAISYAKQPQTVPWKTSIQEVNRLWKQITDPRNERALEEWLFQATPGQWELWAQHALLECRARRSQSPGRQNEPKNKLK